MRFLPLLMVLVLRAAAADFEELDRVVAGELKSTNTPGAAVGVIVDGRMVYAKGYGLANVETGVPVTPDMLFRLGSTTKMFVAAGVVSLAEEGKLRLDRPVGESIPGLNARVARVTPHQLLTHTAGFSDEAPMFGPQDDAALGNGIRAWTENRFFTEPGKIYSYSNPGYWMLGFLIEQLSGKPFADAMSERIFRPLGMARTTFRPTMAMTYPLAQGHGAANGKLEVVRPAPNNASGWPAGSMFSNVEDLARFVTVFLNGGSAPVTAAVIAKLSTPYVEIPKATARYGYALRVEKYRGATLLEHSGDRTGYGSVIRMVPERRVGVIVLINKSSGKLPKTAEKALELALPL